MADDISAGKKAEWVSKLKEFVQSRYAAELVAAANAHRSLVVDCTLLEMRYPELTAFLRAEPIAFFAIAAEAMKGVDLVDIDGNPVVVRLRFSNLPELTSVRDLRARHIGQFVSTEGTVRRASEIRPEIRARTWECPECQAKIIVESVGTFAPKPFECPGNGVEPCGNRKGFKETEKIMVDTRMITIEEPFELTEGDRPSQVAIALREDLVDKEGRRITEAGSRLRITGVLREVPKDKFSSTKLDFFIEADHAKPTEVGWERVDISAEDEALIRQLAAQPDIYEQLIASMAPSLYGLTDVKESIIMQLFGGVPRTLKDKTRFRGDIHILLLGDPACLVGDERVFLGDGTIAKIQSLGKSHLQDIRVPVRVRGHESSMATTFHVYKNQPVIEIVTESGKSLKGSLNQPVLVVKDRKSVWKRLDELKEGDRVQVVPGIRCRKTALVPTDWKKPTRRLGPRFRGRIPERWDAKLGALTGYLLGDGYVRLNKGEAVAIVNKDERDLVEPLRSYIRDIFGMEPSVESRKVPDHEYRGRIIRSKNAVSLVVLRSKDLAANLEFLRTKRVPDPIFRSPDSVVKEFLKWLFQADGTVFCKGRGKRAIQLKQKEVELLRDVQMLLLRFGIHSRVYGDNLTIRRGNDIIKFAKRIGFAGRGKSEKLLNLAAEARNLRRVGWQRSERIVKIRREKRTHTVYDIEVPRSNRFIANGIVVHNSGKSQLLKLVPNIIPRGKYVSRKGSSVAGLTATVTKDEQFMGGWVLEAGALVLANRGLLSIDEFEKMAPEDQVGMHEAMEQQTVSVAKASIVATLPAQTSILAGGNPKYSRFDPLRSIADQITIPDTLMSRFDLKFILKDDPRTDRDTKIVDHVLQSREEGDTLSIPKIDSAVIRKYIAFAKSTCKPRVTKETGKLLKDFYLQMRKQAESGGPVPITLRQFEALMRLSEASARVQLSDVVRKEDADRAIRLMYASLRELGYDPHTKTIDIDRAEGGTGFTERNRLQKMMDLIAALSQKKKDIPERELLELAEQEGIPGAEVLIDKLKREGTIFSPNVGFIRKV